MGFGMTGVLVSEGYRAARAVEISPRTRVILGASAGAVILVVAVWVWSSGPSHRVPSPEDVAIQQKASVDYLRTQRGAFGSDADAGHLRRPTR